MSAVAGCFLFLCRKRVRMELDMLVVVSVAWLSLAL